MGQPIGTILQSFRKAKNISQFDLEVACKLGLGTIGKIESGKIKLGKQILPKISQNLGLTVEEVLRLQDSIKIKKQLEQGINKVSQQRSNNETLQTAANLLQDVPHQIGSAIYLIEGGDLVFKVASESWFSKKLVKLAKKATENAIKYKLSINTQNSLVKAVIQRQILIEESMYNCTRPKIQKPLSDLIQGIIGAEVVLIIPILDGEDTIGTYAMAYSNHKFLNENFITLCYLASKTTPLIMSWLRD